METKTKIIMNSGKEYEFDSDYEIVMGEDHNLVKGREYVMVQQKYISLDDLYDGDD